MKSAAKRELSRRFAAQHGLVSQGQLRTLSIDRHFVAQRIRSGDWVRVGRKVVRNAAAPTTQEQALLAACFEAGHVAVASHRSAAWLWELAGEPSRHAVTVPRGRYAQVSFADVHRSLDYPTRVSERRGIPVTNPLRTLVDVASVATEDELDDIVDRSLASRLVTLVGILAEIDRVARQGRAGVGPLRRSLRNRGLVGAPNPSVLESKLLRLLHANGIVPLGVEVKMGPNGRYRIDVLLTPKIVVEVDGFASHHTPEQKAEDERRRNRLRLSGLFVLVYTWRDVTYDYFRVVSEIRQALATASSPA
jgi:very-short-patch-repair endonuclease